MRKRPPEGRPGAVLFLGRWYHSQTDPAYVARVEAFRARRERLLARLEAER